MPATVTAPKTVGCHAERYFDSGACGCSRLLSLLFPGGTGVDTVKKL